MVERLEANGGLKRLKGLIRMHFCTLDALLDDQFRDHGGECNISCSAGWVEQEGDYVKCPSSLRTSRPRYWSKTADVGPLLGLWLAEVTSLC